MDSREPSRLNSSEPSGMMMGSNSYGGGVPNSSISMVIPNSAGMIPGMHLSFSPMTSSLSKPMDTSSSLYHGDGGQVMRQSGVFNMGETMKKKRGRPRKYGPDGSVALALSPLSPPSGYSNSSMSEPSVKRRGRPPGSGKKQQLDALGSPGIAFTPHVITVKSGEDVAAKIMAFSQQGPRSVCILSANGAICNVTVRQPAISSGIITYEGRFEIVSLSGSFLLTTEENGGTRSRTGGLSVALAGSDGRVIGGVVAGMLMAATPVQVVVGSFIAEGKKPKPEPVKRDPSSALMVVSSFTAEGKNPKPDSLKHESSLGPPQMPGFGAASASSPPSQGTSSESSDGSGSPIQQSGGTWNNSGQHLQSMPSYAPIGWTHNVNQHRHAPDMKMMP